MVLQPHHLTVEVYGPLELLDSDPAVHIQLPDQLGGRSPVKDCSHRVVFRQVANEVGHTDRKLIEEVHLPNDSADPLGSRSERCAYGMLLIVRYWQCPCVGRYEVFEHGDQFVAVGLIRRGRVAQFRRGIDNR